MIRNSRRRKSKLKFLLLLLAIVLIGWFLYYKVGPKKPYDSGDSPAQNANNQAEVEPGWRPAAGSLQPAIEEFVNGHKGTYSIVIINPEDGTVLADYQGDNEYFTASIYKLYVAYVGYQKIDDGTYQLDDAYLSGYTRGECLDAMIRDSYSPCAEKMWVELGKENLTQKMESLGLTNTSLVGLSTSAKDAAIILQKIERGEGLSEQSKQAFLDSMKTQEAIYRRGLPSGFTNATVFNKVGWNELVEWHDAAIVDFGNGKKLIVSVLTKNAGMANLAALAEIIQANLPN